MIPALLLCLPLVSTIPNWTMVDSGVTSSIRGISAIDAQTCWFGTKSGVARTTDGGKNWQFSKIGENDELDFRDLHAFNAQRCVAMSAGTGEASRIYLTTDGGATWKLVHRNKEPAGFFNGLAFRNERNGILAGDPIDGRLFLLTTRDGGAKWTRIAATTSPLMKKREHAFAASGTHLAVREDQHVWVTSGGSEARVFHSPDWGRSWKSIASPMISGQPSTGIFSIAFHGQHGIAVGGDYEKESEGRDNAMRTTDGGLTWELIAKDEKRSPFHFRSAVGYLDDTTLIAVGPSGTDLSRDGGLTWTSLPGDSGFHTLSISGNTVWAAGAKGLVGRLRVRAK